MVMPLAFHGAGDTMTPTKIYFFCVWLLEIPLPYLLAIRLGVEEGDDNMAGGRCCPDESHSTFAL
jgi:hypothetical protein